MKTDKTVPLAFKIIKASLEIFFRVKKGKEASHSSDLTWQSSPISPENEPTIRECICLFIQYDDFYNGEQNINRFSRYKNLSSVLRKITDLKSKIPQKNLCYYKNIIAFLKSLTGKVFFTALWPLYIHLNFCLKEPKTLKAIYHELTSIDKYRVSSRVLGFVKDSFEEWIYANYKREV